ncbi:MAG: biopolymer transporter ExbD [Kiritimatiellia bacterium]
MKMPNLEMEEAKFAMAPMIDMVFLLLVFFMCASHLSTARTLPIDIPTASRGVVPKDRPDRWIVNITKDGAVFSGDQPMEVDALRNAIAAARKTDPNLKVYLRADADARHKSVRKVMAAMAEAGVDDFIFGVYSPDAQEAAP